MLLTVFSPPSVPYTFPGRVNFDSESALGELVSLRASFEFPDAVLGQPACHGAECTTETQSRLMYMPRSAVLVSLGAPEVGGNTYRMGRDERIQTFGPRL